MIHDSIRTSMHFSAGKGSGLSFQNLPNFYVVTTSTPFIGEAEAGNHYGPARSFLGDVDTHDNGMGELLVGADGKVLQFDPRNVLDGGNMVLWDDAKGGSHPWDPNYFKAAQGLPTDPEFDPLVSLMLVQTETSNFVVLSWLTSPCLLISSSSCSMLSTRPTPLQPIPLELRPA